MRKFTRRWCKESLLGIFMPFGGFYICGGDPMSAPEVKRKLTATLSADVEGYSRLMCVG